MNRHIKKVAILGSGVMGSRIACHFANIGVEALLLDIVPKELTKEEKAKKLKLTDKAVRNRIVDSSLQSVLKSNPSPIYKKDFAKRISTGNFEDNFENIADADWIIEAVIENLVIKKTIFEQVEKHRTPGAIITTNTSGIPIQQMLDGRSEDFQRHFCGAHFFNPPRYLRLLEIIPSKKTKPEVVDFLKHYGDLFLGKAAVPCNDTPAFIANRIGLYAVMSIFDLMQEMDLSIEEVDALTGTMVGKPKSATFRTLDIVGLDTTAKVASGVYDNCKKDEVRELFKAPDFINKMIENNWLGDKTKQGFYKKTKNKEGKTEILTLDLKTLKYRPKKKAKFPSFGQLKLIDNLKERLRKMPYGKDKAAEFFKKFSYNLFVYASNRIPEVAEELYKVDAALNAGFGWDLGPFETWDVLGVEETVKQMKAAGSKPAAWVENMLKAGVKSFYTVKEGKRQYYDITSKSYKNIPGLEDIVFLDNYRATNVVWKNSGTTLFDIGDGILNLEFHTKMNSMGGEVIEGISKAIDIAEKDYRGLVIGNEAPNFSAGANLAMIFMFAVEQEYDEIDFAVRLFQKTMMRCRYSSIPVVAVPHGLTLGGGCELCLHVDSVQAAAETYIGLVEVGVGLIPAGGGSKEFALRASDSYFEGDVELPTLQQKFLTIGMAKVATSAYEAYDLGIFRHGQDQVVINQNRAITEAKRKAISLADAGYTQPIQRKDVKVLGRTGLGMFLAGIYGFYAANYMSEHDKLISEKLASVMCGGDLSAVSYVSEQYLLDLEREAFLSLCGEKKTLERIQSILTTGRPLRN